MIQLKMSIEYSNVCLLKIVCLLSFRIFISALVCALNVLIRASFLVFVGLKSKIEINFCVDKTVFLRPSHM